MKSQRRSIWSWRALLIWLLILLPPSSFLLSGCAARPDNSGPADAARRFVAALEARDAGAIVGLLEPTDWRAEIGPELRGYLAMISAIELRDPAYSVARNDGTTAQVHITGTLAYTLAEGGASGERPVDLRVEAVRVGDSWYLRSLDLPQTSGEGAARPSGTRVASAAARAPSDPLYPEQWALARVGAPCAWGITTGREDLIVAVVDSGVDMNHPDLQGRLRRDGFDFVDSDGDPADENGHGTHVSGIIAATLGNAEGGAGLAPTVQILPVRVMSGAGAGGDRRIAAGVDYAVQKGARVINLSLGSTLLLAAPESSPLISAAIGRALAAGAVVVVAAGNDFVPLPNAIVGESAGAIVVAAATRDDRKAVFSNSGPWVDVTAPGEHILSTMPTYPVFLTSQALPADQRFKQGYDYMSGTSQAAPFVSALAALLLSRHPEWTAAQVAEAITASSADIYPNMPSYYRRLRLLGGGRIDACAALGGAGAQPGLLARLGGQGGLALGLGAAGALLLAVALSWAARARRRRPPARAEEAPPRGLPAEDSSPNIGDTLVAEGAAWGRLLVLRGGREAAAHRLVTPSVVVGRSEDATVTISGDPLISRAHARLTFLGGRAQIADMGSSHGTLLNGRPLSGPTPLRPGDVIVIGETTLRYEDASP